MPALLLVTSAADDGTTGTLRWAIDQSNATPGVRDTIQFAIGAQGSQQTINLAANLGALPAITDAVFIDGFSQACGRTNPLIEIDGTNVAGDGLVEQAGNTIIEGLVISHFSDGIDLNNPANSPGDQVYGCWIGCGLSGTSTTSGNGFDGITVTGANDCIGGNPSAGYANIISGNTKDGVLLTGTGAHDNTLYGNYIGVDNSEKAALGNGSNRVSLANGAARNHIGDDINRQAGYHNVISGNRNQGVSIISSTSNVVYNDLIGLGVDGVTAVGNALNGVYARTSATGNTVTGCVISANGGSGVLLSGMDVSGNVVQSCSIGTTADGESARGNGAEGVWLDLSANNTIGGGVASQGNVISGNANNGVKITGMSNKIYWNFIGTDKSGAAAVANTLDGVLVTGSSNLIGTANAGNVISGNSANGIEVQGGNTQIVDNYIGTDVSGVVAVKNTNDGILLTNPMGAGPTGTTIGSGAVGGGNLISGNGNCGIEGTNGCDRTSVQGNIIGLNAVGDDRLGNLGPGVSLAGSNITIGGASDPQRNTISANRSQGLLLKVYNSTIAGNYIGVGKNGWDTMNPSGTANLGNGSAGIWLTGSGNTIGGTQAGAGNVIGMNVGNGIDIRATGGMNMIYNNWVGAALKSDGTVVPAGNGLDGIYVERSSQNTIGGPGNNQANFVYYNKDIGVELGVGANTNSVQMNYIGKDKNGVLRQNTNGWKKDNGAGNIWSADIVHD